eukprot:m.38401 g.38401  ORF g.38401 m.38401 type:complete len:518 (-) comp11181_c0_seq1:251-1804(-)
MTNTSESKDTGDVSFAPLTLPRCAQASCLKWSLRLVARSSRSVWCGFYSLVCTTPHTAMADGGEAAPGPVTRFTNCRVCRPSGIETEDVWVQDGRIIDARVQFWEVRRQADVVVDCKGLLLAPGFIDLQINGAFGVDFTNPTQQRPWESQEDEARDDDSDTDADAPDGPKHADQLNEEPSPAPEVAAEALSKGIAYVSRRLVEHGVTAYCPTLVTSSPHTYQSLLPAMRPTVGGKHGAAVLGAHLEGPFLNPLKKGAHKEELMRGFEAADGASSSGLESIELCYGSLDNCSIITLAPELPNAGPVIEALAARNIVVSLGHTAADLEHADEAVTRGARMLTHLFNAMSAFHHRNPGVVGLLSETVRAQRPLFYGLIVDGIHTHDAAMRIAASTHPKGAVLVTDAIAAMGLPPGRHSLGRQSVHKDHDNRVTVEGTDTLAGSGSTMIDCVSYFARIVGVTQAVAAATLHPAQVLGIADRKGTCDVGADADFVLLDDSQTRLRVTDTYIGGERVWHAKEE